MADTRQVQITARGQVLVFVEHLGFSFKCKQAAVLGTQMFFQALCEIHRNCPVRTGFPRCRNGFAYMGNTPLRVCHCAVLFSPTGGGQQQVGEGRGFGGVKRLLQHHKRAGLQRRPHGSLVRHGLRGVGAGDPHGLDLAAGHLLKEFDGAQAGVLWQLLNTPVSGDFGPVFGIGRITMAG